MVITSISDKEEYENKLLEFESNLKQFYNAGKHTFLTQNFSNPGDDETFYLHCLCFYMPKIANKTFEKHGVGLGIFTMQGFERCIKESKNIFKRFQNYKGNPVVHNLKRLYDVFESRHNKV